MGHLVRLSRPVPPLRMSNVGWTCICVRPTPLPSPVVHRRDPIHGNETTETIYELTGCSVFRLLPGPPHRISLYEPLHQGHPLILPSEDTEEQARERTDRITSTGVVVEFGDLLKDGSAHWPSVSHF